MLMKEYSYKGLELAQILGQLGVFLISRTVGTRIAARQVAHIVLLAEGAVVLPWGRQSD